MFDRFVVVDWSASSTPKLGRDSIWIADHDQSGVRVTNVSTRAAAEDVLVELLASDSTSSVLIGVDFSLGYPEGTAASLGLTGTPWSAMWALLAESIVDDDRNANNRFAVAAALNAKLTGGAAPFWGCPPAQVSSTLAATKSCPPGGLAEWRTVEALLRAHGRRPFSSWQLLGAGAVGSQSLLGIPMIARLGERLGKRLDVWPFTTGFDTPTADDGAIVVAEVWPSMLTIDTDGTVRDAAQVAAMASCLAEADRDGGLDALWAPGLSSEEASAAIAEEGWVLGVVP